MGSMLEHDECELLRRLRQTPRLFELLEAGFDSELRRQRELREQFPDDLVRAALLLAELRRKGAAKFRLAPQMWFDRRGLEQATGEVVAQHKARRFTGRVWDFCTGIGGDLLALAEHCDVIGVDRSPAACLRAQWNAEVYGVSGRAQLVCAPVETISDRTGWLHVDPDRRPGAKGGRRTLRIEDAIPGLDDLRQYMAAFAGGAIKLSPAANFAGKFPHAEIELTSVAGECKEATIWFGELAQPGVWRATVLPEGATLAGNPLDADVCTGPLEGFLYDPDPSVVRSGLIDLLAQQAGLMRLDDAEEYLTSTSPVDTPFARRFEVLADLANNDREIRRYFREADFGQVEIKCRHIPIDSDKVRRKLSLTGSGSAVLIFARVAGRARAVVCRRVTSE